MDVGPVGVDGVGQQLAYWFDLGGVAVDEDEGDAAGGPGLAHGYADVATA